MTQTTLDSVAVEVTDMLLNAINSVYRPGAHTVTDSNGNPPSEDNNYLLSEAGDSFSGIFTDNDNNEFPFTVRDKNGVWELKY